MASYKVFNVRGIQVGSVYADSDIEAMKLAKEKGIIAPTVERELSRAEEIQKQYNDEVDLWESMNRYR